jgi:hypothetical protein
VTIAWFIVWLIASLIGGTEPLELEPPNGWTATLVLAFALDVNRPSDLGRRGA